MPRKSREDWKIYKNVFDSYTEQSVLKLISQGVIDGLQSPVKIGKESNVFTAQSRQGLAVVKIYRLASCNFNRMHQYIRDDSRYLHLKNKRRDVILAWVQREYRNLLKAREAGVRVPSPLAMRNNCIVMEFIGGSQPAPQLKDGVPQNPARFLREIIRNISLLHKAGLVHADLSEYNILNHDEKPVLIDFSQSVPLRSSRAQEYLSRDIRNMARFFSRHSLKVTEAQIMAKLDKEKAKGNV